MSDIKVIFLDIDGVLNNILRENVSRIEGMEGIYHHDPKCVKLLNNLIAATDAKIVVSSTWRLGETMDSMNRILKGIGVVGKLIGMTPRLDKWNLRGNEIRCWINTHAEEVLNCKAHEFQNYVILDDDSDMLLWQVDNFIHVDPSNGLTKRDICKAYRILMTQHPKLAWEWVHDE